MSAQVAATVIGGYLLTQLHFNRAPEPPAQPQQAAAEPAAAPSTSEVPTVREDRAAMRGISAFDEAPMALLKQIHEQGDGFRVHVDDLRYLPALQQLIAVDAWG